MKFCTKCGAQNEDNALICIQCKSNLSVMYTFPPRDLRKAINKLLNILGVTTGVLSLILGIITFTTTSISNDTKLLIMEEAGSEARSIIEVFTAPAKAFSFGMGSLLVVIGILLVLYFVDKLLKKDK